MKEYLFWILVAVALVYLIFFSAKGQCPLEKNFYEQEAGSIKEIKKQKTLEEGLNLLKNRRDNDASAIFEKALLEQPDNLDALWGKAEVLRRKRNYKESEELLSRILSRNPGHSPSLISLSYIRYKDNRFNEALKLINKVLKGNYADRESEALAYTMLAAINTRRAKEGWFFNKLIYGAQVKCYFLKAKELAPDLPETSLGLGTFYLLAPAIVGGNLYKAMEELELAVKCAPDFATANARLAQAYKKKGLPDKYSFYIARAEALDPGNEALLEIKQDR